MSRASFDKNHICCAIAFGFFALTLSFVRPPLNLELELCQSTGQIRIICSLAQIFAPCLLTNCQNGMLCRGEPCLALPCIAMEFFALPWLASQCLVLPSIALHVPSGSISFEPTPSPSFCLLFHPDTICFSGFLDRFLANICVHSPPTM